MIDQAVMNGMSLQEYHDREGRLVRVKSFDIRFIKSEFRRLKAESEGFQVNLAAIFRNTQGESSLSGSAVQNAVAAYGSGR